MIFGSSRRIQRSPVIEESGVVGTDIGMMLRMVLVKEDKIKTKVMNKLKEK